MLDHRLAPRILGEETWWRGPLPVETLALRSASAALTAAHGLLGERRFALETRRLAAAFGSIGHLRIEGEAPAPFGAMSGFFRCRDGWLRTHANYPHHRLALQRALGVEDAAGLAAALLEREAAETEERVFDAGGLAVRVRGREEWLGTLPAEGRGGADGAGSSRSGGPSRPAGFSRTADPSHPAGSSRTVGPGPATPRTPWVAVHPAEEAEAGRRPATASPEGLRVLDLTRVIAGPTGTKFLAALGAEVLRIDPPQHPELLAQHLDTDDGKRSAAADLREAGTLNRVRELAGAADVVVTGYRPGALARFGLDAETLLAERPGLSVVELDAWGGCPAPWAGRRGFDSLVQAASGIAVLYGSRRGAREGRGRGPHSGRGSAAERWRPGALPVQALDHATGYCAAAAALALLRTGGRARLSLARTAEELFSLPGLPPGLPRRQAPELVEMDSPHGRLTKVAPLIGEPLAPGRYGASPLAWD
ncbi:CoA transferase [Rothia halotolerans]|uniref:CoA transferase n=1 Tax=Rothia halotolerans TaxID=405770 RepID=UPI001EDFCF08|nr:CoA transferase [Rothia halotolerans]